MNGSARQGEPPFPSASPYPPMVNESEMPLWNRSWSYARIAIKRRNVVRRRFTLREHNFPFFFSLSRISWMARRGSPLQGKPPFLFPTGVSTFYNSRLAGTGVIKPVPVCRPGFVVIHAESSRRSQTRPFFVVIPFSIVFEEYSTIETFLLFALSYLL